MFIVFHLFFKVGCLGKKSVHSLLLLRWFSTLLGGEAVEVDMDQDLYGLVAFLELLGMLGSSLALRLL